MTAKAQAQIMQILTAAHRWIEDGTEASANQAKVAIGRAEILIEKHGLRREDFHFPGDPTRKEQRFEAGGFEFSMNMEPGMASAFRDFAEAVFRETQFRERFRTRPYTDGYPRNSNPHFRPLGCTCPPGQDWKLRHAAECGLSCTCPKGYAIGRFGHTQACVERRQRASGLSGTRADHVIFDEDYRRPGGFSDPFNEPPQHMNCRSTIKPQQGEFDANGRPRRRKL